MAYAPHEDSDQSDSALWIRAMEVSSTACRAYPRQLLALAAAALAWLMIGPALAAEKAAPKPAPKPAAQTLPTPKQLGTFDAWTAVELAQTSGKICYAFSRPSVSEPKGIKRSEDVMVVITHRPAAKKHDEVSYQSGYKFKDGAPVAVDIDGKKFSFFTRADVDPEAAWAENETADKAIIAGLKAGKTLKVRGTSSRNTDVTDTFRLSGFGKAYAEIGKACGVK